MKLVHVTPPAARPPLRSLGRQVPLASERHSIDVEGELAVVASDATPMILLVRTTTGEQVGSFADRELEGYDEHVQGVWLRKGKGIVAMKGAVVGFNPKSGKKTFVFPLKLNSTQHVRGAALDPLGKILFCTLSTDEIRGWDLEKKRLVFSGKQPDLGRGRLAVSPDGTHLAGEGGGVNVWDIKTRKQVARFGGKKNELESPVFGIDGTTLFAAEAAGRDGPCRIHQFRLGKAKAQMSLEGHPGGILMLLPTADGKSLVSTGFDRAIKVWDLSSGRCRAAFETSEWVENAVLLKDGSELLTRDGDGAIVVWDMGSGQVDPSPALPAVTRLAFEKSRFLATSLGNQVRSGEVKEGAPMTLLVDDAQSDATNPNAPKVALSPDARWGLVARPQGVMEKWDLKRGKCATRTTGTSTSTERMAFLPSGKRCALILYRSLSLWDLGKNDYLGRTEDHWNNPSSLVVTGETRAVFIAREQSVREWDLADLEAEPIRRERGVWKSDFPTLSPDGQKLVGLAHRQKPNLHLGDLMAETLDGKVLSRYAAHDFQITAVAVNNELCASGDKGGALHVWRLTDGKAVATWQGPARITACAWSAEGRLALGDSTGRVRILSFD